MLDGIKTDRGWKWSAYGKHAAAKDYFRIGRDGPLSGAFSIWIERGYTRLAAKSGPLTPPVSWRFWTRESGEGQMACGLLKDSADAVGRPYPMLVMGSGPAPGWADHWDLVPVAFESAWAQMEYISTRSFADVKALEAEIGNVKAPSTDWRDFEEKRKEFEEISREVLDMLNERIHGLSEAEPVLCIDGQSYRPFDLIHACHRLLRAESKEPPNAVFMGGTVLHTYLAVFRKALTESDFIRLWSLPDEKAAAVR